MVTSIDDTRLRLTAEDGSDGVLLGARCGECGVYAFGSAVMCVRCTSGALEEVTLSARGSLYSYTLCMCPLLGGPAMSRTSWGRSNCRKALTSWPR